MAIQNSLTQLYKITSGTPPITSNGGLTCDYICLKNVHKCWIVVGAHNLGAANATLLTPMRATGILPAGAVVLAAAVQIWVNDDTATTDTLVAQAAAINYTLTADANPKLIVFEIDPAALGATYDCISLVVGNSGNAGNHISVNYFCDMRYKQATPPSVILN